MSETIRGLSEEAIELYKRIDALEAENAELRKRLECPVLVWKNGSAWFGNWLVGTIDYEEWNETKPSAELAYYGVSNVRDHHCRVYVIRHTSKVIAMAAVENAWLEFWNKIHGIEVKK